MALSTDRQATVNPAGNRESLQFSNRLCEIQKKFVKLQEMLWKFLSIRDQQRKARIYARTSTAHFPSEPNAFLRDAVASYETFDIEIWRCCTK